MPTIAEQESALLRAGPATSVDVPSQILMSLPRTAEKYYSSIATLTTAASPVTLFTVTGLVLAKVVAEGSALTSVSNTGTLAVGVTGATTALLGTTTINTTNFPTAGAVWAGDTSPTVLAEVVSAAALTGALLNSNIILTIATNNMSTGSLRFCCIWQPISANGAVVAA